MDKRRMSLIYDSFDSGLTSWLNLAIFPPWQFGLEVAPIPQCEKASSKSYCYSARDWEQIISHIRYNCSVAYPSKTRLVKSTTIQPTMKTILAVLALSIAPYLAHAQGLADQRAQAQQVAQSNGAADAANVAGQLASAFGNQQNAQALLTKAKQLATATPSEAKAIAAAAAVFNPAGAAEIAAGIAKMFPKQAAAIAAAVAAVVPSQSNAIRDAVVAAVPEETSAIESVFASGKNVVAAEVAVAGAEPNQTTTGFGNNTQNTTQNPANFSGGQTNSPSN